MLVLPVFAYGTLLPGQPNHHLWESDIVVMAPATFPNGRIFDLGFYPMLVEGSSGVVKGRLFSVQRESYKQVIRCLDELEGYDPGAPDAAGYRRVVRDVMDKNGRLTRAWVYMGHSRHVVNARPIAGGDWVNHVSTKLDHLNAWWQSVNSVSGLHGAGL